MNEYDDLQERYDQLRDNIEDPYAMGVQSAMESLRTELAEAVRLLREALDILGELGVALMHADIFLAEHEDVR